MLFADVRDQSACQNFAEAASIARAVNARALCDTAGGRGRLLRAVQSA